MKKKLLVCLKAFVFIMFIHQVKAQTPAYKGIFVDTFDAIVGNTVKEDSLLHYLKDSAYNSIVCYQISSVVSSVSNSTKNTNLASFMKKARTQYGIKNISASSEVYETFANLISPYNRSRADSNERFNYYYLEFEFWNVHSTSQKSASNNGYYCTNYLSPKGYNCDTAGAFKYYRKMLKSLDSLAGKDGIRSATYVGKPNLGQGKFIASTVDLLLCDNYTANINNIYLNCQTRYSYFGSGTKTIQIVPIFASYSPDGPFLGDWLVKAPVGPHSEKGVYNNYFLPKFNAETAAWKSKINIIGYQWYRYSGMPHNGNYTASSACNSPGSISFSAVSTTSATVSWSTAGNGISYLLQYRVSGSNTWSSPISVAGVSTTLSNLTASTAYEIQIKTNCSSKSSAYSSSTLLTTLASLTCSTPSGLNASSITSITTSLNWNLSLGALSYSIRYRKTGTSTWTSASSVLPTIVLSNLTAATSYEFQLAAVCALGTSSYSASSTFNTTALATCSAPIGLTVGSITSNTALLSWAAISGVSGYTLNYRVIGSSSWNSLGCSTNSINISGLLENSSYEYQVQTNCSSGSSSSYSSSVIFSTPIASCGTPSAVTAKAATTNSITVSWQNSTAAISYTIQYKKASSSSWTSISSTGTYKNISGLTIGTNYNYRVAMVCASGTSSYSSSGNITTMSNSSSCAVPNGLFVSDVLNDAVTLNWLPVAGANLYTIQYRKVGTSSWTSKTTNFTNKTITALSANTSYQFQVGTACSVSSSNYSSSFTFTTSATTGRLLNANLGSQVNSLDSLSRPVKSIEEIIPEQQFLIFPNPSPGNIFSLRIRLNQKESISIALYDMLGKLILTQTETTDETGFMEVSIRPDFDLKMGIYQVVGYTGGKEKLACKLIVQ